MNNCLEAFTAPKTNFGYDGVLKKDKNGDEGDDVVMMLEVQRGRTDWIDKKRNYL